MDRQPAAQMRVVLEEGSPLSASHIEYLTLVKRISHPGE